MPELNTAYETWRADPSGPATKPGGNDDALFEAIWLSARPMARKIQAKGALPPAFDWEDLASEAAFTVMAQVRERQDVGNLAAYLHRSIFYRMLDIRRHEGSAAAPDNEDEHGEPEPRVPDPAPTPDASADSAMVHACVDELRSFLEAWGARSDSHLWRADVLIQFWILGAEHQAGENIEQLRGTWSISEDAAWLRRRRAFATVPELWKEFEETKPRCATALRAMFDDMADARAKPVRRPRRR